MGTYMLSLKAVSVMKSATYLDFKGKFFRNFCLTLRDRNPAQMCWSGWIQKVAQEARPNSRT